VRPYVKAHQKTDHTDAAGLLEAARNPKIQPVVPKTVEQQALAALHRIRTQWMTSRTARINMVRGLLAEFGLTMPRGARTACRMAGAIVTDDTTLLPGHVREALQELLREIRALEERVQGIDQRLTTIAASHPTADRLQRIPGIGLVTATGLLATVPDIHAFRTGRRFASWLGLTPSERSSGERRRMGRISKAGDRYLRCLLTQGARSVLRAAHAHHQRGSVPAALHRWALAVEQRRGANKAAIALANKLARVIWVVWSREVEFCREPRPAAA
jgi:transposase